MIRNDVAWEAKVCPNMGEEKLNNLRGCCCLVTGQKKSHPGEATDNDPNSIMFAQGHRKATKKFHGDIFPRSGWDR